MVGSALLLLFLFMVFINACCLDLIVCKGGLLSLNGVWSVGD